MRTLLVTIFLFFLCHAQAQQTANPQDTAKQKYTAGLKAAGRTFSSYFYPNYATIYALPENQFIAKIDSARESFNGVLDKYRSRLDTAFIKVQQTEIKYYFDRLLIEYPLNHPIYSTEKSFASTIPQRLKNNLADFNRPELLTNTDFTDYVRSFFSYQVSIELKRSVYKNTDNRHLNAAWILIPQFISDPQCREFWKSDYLYNHIENNGIKNIESIYTDFLSTCRDTARLNKIKTIYSEDVAGRKGHLVRTYKKVDAFNLDMHIFLPDSLVQGNKRPVIVYFHGGSWSEGKPDWFFSACESYAKKGWIACAVEYRTYGRQGTLPFAAVMDAKSAIRWIRQHAKEYNIDTGKIVASGNSAGGHLVLCAALTGKWNEKTDDLKFSAAPNVLLVNAGVYDLADQATAWIRKDLRNKDLVKEISPNHLIQPGLPPTLIIHGTNDRNVPYSTASEFVAEMKKAGNTTIEFQPLQGAGHFIWYDPKYAAEVTKLRNNFLTRLGY